MDPKTHWEAIYRSKAAEELSWYQPSPTVSLDLIRRTVPATASILDVGGGASTLVDGLLDGGYRDITVLDLSASALEQTRHRLGAAGSTVRWLEADILAVELPAGGYDLWHDRAVFHFLNRPEARQRYVAQVAYLVRPGGYVLVATFAEDGPTTCSGLDVSRYDAQGLHHEFGRGFRLLTSMREHHLTPWGAEQSFVYCLCRVEPEAMQQVA